MIFCNIVTVPPGDEGWLCPGCDCKIDCIDFINDVLDLDLSIEDAWEVDMPFFHPSIMTASYIFQIHVKYLVVSITLGP